MENSEMQTTLIDYCSAFEELQAYVANSNYEFVVIDTETDNKVEKLAQLMGIGLCFEDHEAFYIPIRDKNKGKWWTEAQEKTIVDWIIDLCKTKKIIGHNVLYDILVLFYNWGVDLTEYIYSDTILQKHTLDEDRPFGLKEVAVKYLGPWADKAQQSLYENIKVNGGSVTKENTEMWRADTTILGEYCCWDVLLTMKLFNIFEARLVTEKLFDLFYKDEIMPLYKCVTIPMKKKGFTIDLNYFNNLNKEIGIEINKLELSIQSQIQPAISSFISATLDKHYPVKSSGSFPKVCAEVLGFDLPTNKTGRITLSKKEIDKILEPQLETHRNFLHWLRGEESLDREIALKAQVYWHQKDNPESSHIFNLQSNDHLKWLFFEHHKEKPLSYTDSKQPQVDDDFLDTMKSKHGWVLQLIDYKKLNKLKSTYIEGVLERHIDGAIYSSFVQFGPPSGRYASRDPNLQNLPRVKEDDAGLSELVLRYVNSIKKGFIAPEGYILVNADYSQLEPRAFAEACGDKLLQQGFIDNEDLYGSIARRVFKLSCTANEVKKKYPEMRQKAKIIALAVVYGAEAGRISQLMGIDYMDAHQVITDYLNSYPGLKTYMSNCNKEVCTEGQVKTKFGRIRHLPAAKEIFNKYGLKLLDRNWSKAQGLDETRWKFKSMLNLAKNYKIQGVAAHIVNRAAIAINQRFIKEGIEGQIIAQVHDELTCLVRKDQSERAKSIVKDCMENTTKISVPLKAEPLVAMNWADAK